MPSSDDAPLGMPALVLDDEEAIEDLASIIFDFHERLADAACLYSPEMGRGSKRSTCGKIVSVLSVTFCTIFDSSPSERFVDLFDQASYLAEHLAKDHLFRDGNKRTALLVSFAILHSGGVVVEFEDTDDPMTNPYYSWIQDVVSGTRSRAALAEALREAAARL